jgi:hypothetical protein
LRVRATEASHAAFLLFDRQECNREIQLKQSIARPTLPRAAACAGKKALDGPDQLVIPD